MPDQPLADASRLVPPARDLDVLRAAARGCTACPLHLHGTQTVFGEGPARALALFVGEQPGDAEDLAGRPFVGPAGKLLDRAMDAAGIDRRKVYVTNAVKHFKWKPRGKKRLHAKPNAAEVHACRPWLEAEILAIEAPLVVCLGATAAQALLGRDFRVTRDRGRVLQVPFAAEAIATVHPSALLRAPDPETREREIGRFVADLWLVAERMAIHAAGY